MLQGYSGSTLRRQGELVEKVSSDESFTGSAERQRDLIALSQHIPVIPRIARIAGPSIFMEYVDGQEDLTLRNAPRAGKALRLLHDQRGYPHLCMTGIAWLIELANNNLAEWNLQPRVSTELVREYPADALIHSEPTQLIEKQDGSIVLIDIEGMGMGSRYQDLGFVYWGMTLGGQPEVYEAFIQGYQSLSVEVELRRVKQIANLISIAYVGFALAFAGREEAEKRMQWGLQFFASTRLTP